MSVSVVATIIALAYLVGVMSVGLYMSRARDSTETYFLGGRAFPWWAVSFSLIGTMIGSTTFIGHPGEVFRKNMWSMPLHLMLIPVMIVVARYIVVFYRRNLRMSVYGYLEKRFGYGARAYGALAFMFSRVVDISGTLFFLAIAVSMLAGWDIRTVILVIGPATVLYTLIGGIAAVVWTDVVQGVVLIGSALIFVGYLLFAPAVPPAELIVAAWEGGKFSWGSWEFGLVEDNVWILMALGIVWALQRYAADQHMVQRYLIARDDREARRAATVGGMAALPIWTLFWIFGALLWAFYHTGGGTIPADLVEDKTRIVPFYVLSEFPAPMLGLLVAGLAGSFVGSVTADINSVATVFVEDFYQKARPRASDQQSLVAGKVAVAAAGAACVLVALQWVGVQSAIGFMFDLISVASAGVLGLFVLGILFRRATPRGAVAGILACVAFTAWATFTAVEIPARGGALLDLGAANYPWNVKLIGVFSSLILLGVGFPASFLLGGRRRDTTALTMWQLSTAPSPPRAEGERA